MSEIKRYDTSENFVHEFDGMKESEYGEWVKFSEVTALRSKIAELEKTEKTLSGEIDKLCDANYELEATAKTKRDNQ